MPESGENRSMLGQTLASELSIKVYKEISAINNDITETVDSIMMTCNEPKCGLNDTEVAEAKELDSGTNMMEFFSEKPILAATITAVASVGVAVIVMLMNSKK